MRTVGVATDLRMLHVPAAPVPPIRLGKILDSTEAWNNGGLAQRTKSSKSMLAAIWQHSLTPFPANAWAENGKRSEVYSAVRVSWSAGSMVSRPALDARFAEATV
jgi:hypothetical protein